MGTLDVPPPGKDTPVTGSVFFVAIVVLGIIFIFKAVVVVSQGWNYTVERFGKYTVTLTPGLHMITPFIESIGRRLNMMEQVLDVPTQQSITKDNAAVTVDGVMFYQVLDAARRPTRSAICRSPSST